MKQFDKVTAVFNPRRTDDLVEGVAEYIGKTLEFEAVWVIEEGVYKDEFAMLAVDRTLLLPWIPSGDLNIINSQTT